MNKNKLIFVFFVICSLIFVTSCRDEDDEWTETQERRYVNNWIYTNMSYYYLWNSNMPLRPNYKQDPSSFFKSLLYNRDKVDGDRFSWMQNSYADLVNSLNGVTSTDIGFEYYTVTMGGATDESIAFTYWVVYVKPGTDAERKGLKRGDIITEVNGITVTEDNYSALLKSNKSSYTLKILDAEIEQYETKTILVESNYIENPIYYSTVYSIGNKKVGYVVYNFFAADRGNNSSEYDTALADKFKEFYNANVSEVILDLRYNGGGSMQSAAYLSSALVPNRSTTKLLVHNQFNPQFQKDLVAKYGEDEALNYYFADNIPVSKTSLHEIPKLGNKINKVYILTGTYTASASEMVINGLKPYMDVEIIGATTYGKNVGSIVLYDEGNIHNEWGLLPIVLKTYNSAGKSDYSLGFEPEPSNRINEFSEYLKPFGYPDEILFRAAIGKITGNQPSGLKSIKRMNNHTVATSLENKQGAFQMFLDSDKIKNLKPSK